MSLRAVALVIALGIAAAFAVVAWLEMDNVIAPVREGELRT